MKLPLAIGHLEGFFRAPAERDYPTRPQRNNNPGDICMGEFAHLHGGVMEDKHGASVPRFAKFATPAAGWAALQALLATPAYKYLTVRECIAKFAPPCENDTNNYVAFVCRVCNCHETDLIAGLLV